MRLCADSDGGGGGGGHAAIMVGDGEYGRRQRERGRWWRVRIT